MVITSDISLHMSHHKKSLMFKYSRMQRKIPSQLVCGSCGMCLDSTLLGVQVTTVWDFFLCSSYIVHSEDNEDSDSLLYRLRLS